MKSTPAICGIDLGSWTFKLCAFNGDRFQVLTNQANFRETPSLVGYTPTERLIGEPAIIKIKNNFANTIRAPQRLIGLQKHKHLLEEELKYQKSRMICEKGLEFVVQGRQGEMRVSTQEVLISLITKAKSIIESHNLQLTLGYISVPTYLGQEERYILKRCAEIGLQKPVRIVDDWTAISAQYAYTRIKQLKNLEQMRNVIFLDVGYSKVSLSLVQFTRFQSRLLDSEHLPYTGCKNMDRNVSQFYNELFLKKFNSVIVNNLKAYPKLLDAVQRQRTVLSANNEHHLNLQYLLAQEDLVYNMTRQQFQNIIVSVLADIAASMASFQSRNCTIPIHSIELIGGGSRIPCIQSIALKIFGMEPSRTLNQSEAIAVGSTVLGCVERKILNLPYSFSAVSTRRIGLKWNKEKKQIFMPQTTLPYTQSLNFGNEGVVDAVIFVEQSLMEKEICSIRFKTPNKLDFTLDQNKILSVKAQLSNLEGNLHTKSQKEWKDIKQKEEEMQKLDIRMGMLYQMKNDFQSKFYWCKNKYEELKQYASQKEISEIEYHIQIATTWIEEEHHNHGNGSEQDLQMFEAKLNEIAILKKLCEGLDQNRKNIEQIKIRYDKLSEEISAALEVKMPQDSHQRLLEIMNWGQEAYQAMENKGWKSNELTLENVQEAIICVKSLRT